MAPDAEASARADSTTMTIYLLFLPTSDRQRPSNAFRPAVRETQNFLLHLEALLIKALTRLTTSCKVCDRSGSWMVA